MARSEEWLEQFEAVYQKHAQRLLRYIYRLTRDTQLAEDIVHEAFVRVFGRSDAGTLEGNLPGLLWVTARNLAFTHLGRAGRMKFGISDQEVVARADPARPLSDEELRNAVNRLVEELPDSEREVFLLKTQAGLSYLEMAEILGCPVGTVKSRMSRAYQRIRRGATGLL